MQEENYNSKHFIKMNSISEQLMPGKKTINKLTPDFFEKVLDQELELKRNFSMDALQVLIQLYSVC